MENKEILVDEITNIITNSIKKINQIITSVQNEDSIDSYESSYCENCNKPCGRSNAEIYNCMMQKINKYNKVQDQYDKSHYTKDFLQEDLKELEKELKFCNDKINKIIKSDELIKNKKFI